MSHVPNFSEISGDPEHEALSTHLVGDALGAYLPTSSQPVVLVYCFKGFSLWCLAEGKALVCLLSAPGISSVQWIVV